MSSVNSNLILIISAMVFALILLILVGIISHRSVRRKDNLIVLQNTVIGRDSGRSAVTRGYGGSDICPLQEFRCHSSESNEECYHRAKTCCDNGETVCPYNYPDDSPVGNN